MHSLSQAIWGHIWKRTVERGQTNITNELWQSPVWSGSTDNDNLVLKDYASSQAGNWGLWFNWCKCEKPEENKWQCHKIKQMQPMSPLEKAIWGDIWKRTVEKNEINANNVTLDLLRWAIWVNKMHSGEKSNKFNQCDYISRREDVLRQHLKTYNCSNINFLLCIEQLVWEPSFDGQRSLSWNPLHC